MHNVLSEDTHPTLLLYTECKISNALFSLIHM